MPWGRQDAPPMTRVLRDQAPGLRKPIPRVIEGLDLAPAAGLQGHRDRSLDSKRWMKHATIDYLRPGIGTVHAEFYVPPNQFDAIKREFDAAGQSEPEFQVEIRDQRDRVVARVDQVVHARPVRTQESEEGQSQGDWV